MADSKEDDNMARSSSNANFDDHDNIKTCVEWRMNEGNNPHTVTAYEVFQYIQRIFKVSDDEMKRKSKVIHQFMTIHLEKYDADIKRKQKRKKVEEKVADGKKKAKVGGGKVGGGKVSGVKVGRVKAGGGKVGGTSVNLDVIDLCDENEEEDNKTKSTVKEKRHPATAKRGEKISSQVVAKGGRKKKRGSAKVAKKKPAAKVAKKTPAAKVAKKKIAHELIVTDVVSTDKGVGMVSYFETDLIYIHH